MARDYKSEYKNYHSKSEQKKNRAARNGARRIMKKKYGSSILGRVSVVAAIYGLKATDIININKNK
jgi:hypothetical protein